MDSIRRPLMSLLTATAALSILLFLPQGGATCPMDFNYVLRIPWNSSACHNFASEGGAAAGSTPCCTTLSSLFGVALATHLKETSLFLLPDVSAAQSCLRDFQSKLDSVPAALPKTLAASCFNPRKFVSRPDVCAGVQDISDWAAKLGRSTAVDRDCRADLTKLEACDGCVSAGFQVQSKLIEIDGRKSHATNCFYITVLYAAGVVNKAGPQSDGALSCILGLPLTTRN